MRVPSRIASLRGGGSNYSLGIRYPVKSGPVGPWDPQWADGLQKKRLAAMRDGRSWSSVSARNATFTEGMFAWLQCIFGSGARAMFASCVCAGDHTAPTFCTTLLASLKSGILECHEFDSCRVVKK